MADDKPEEGPVEHPAFAGRPQDEPLPNTTFAERAASRQPKKKAVQDAENKAVSSSRSSRKSSK
jgi:hypothetical protein